MIAVTIALLWQVLPQGKSVFPYQEFLYFHILSRTGQSRRAMSHIFHKTGFSFPISWSFCPVWLQVLRQLRSLVRRITHLQITCALCAGSCETAPCKAVFSPAEHIKSHAIHCKQSYTVTTATYPTDYLLPQFVENLL